MKLMLELTNRALLRADQEISVDLWKMNVDHLALPKDVRRLVAVRLWCDNILCGGILDEETGRVVTTLDDGGDIRLLRLEGTAMDDLIGAVLEDQDVIEEALAARAARKEKPAA